MWQFLEKFNFVVGFRPVDGATLLIICDIVAMLSLVQTIVERQVKDFRGIAPSFCDVRESQGQYRNGSESDCPLTFLSSAYINIQVGPH